MGTSESKPSPNKSTSRASMARRADSVVASNGGARSTRSTSGDDASGAGSQLEQMDGGKPRKTSSSKLGVIDNNYCNVKRKSKELSVGSNNSGATADQDNKDSSGTSKLNRKQSNVSVNKEDKDDKYSSKKQRAPPHPLTQASRDIIRGCFEEPHADLGNRIQMRVMEKRPDYKEFLMNVGREQWPMIGDTLTQFLDAVVAKIENIDEVQKMSREFGDMHVEWKALGFKPDFWVSIADTMTTECMYLDQAMHGQTEVLEAWSGLVGIVLSNVRDGYYERLRRERRINRKSTQTTSASVDTTSEVVDSVAGKMGSIRRASEGTRRL